ncbi:MAG: RDD family protein [Ruminiclostridium sp.]|nr:RDD family protein [Ruminiclostridium sp.]
MRNVYYVQTPENVSLEFELAGSGSRGVAVAIDMIIQGIVVSIISIILLVIAGESSMNLLLVQENTLYIVIALLLTFVLQFGYFFLFEVFMKGATPGKKIVGLKVIMANGEPISVTAALIRNFIRIGDMLPGIYAVGVITVFFSSKYMRVGDIAANTVVVKVRKKKNSLAQPSVIPVESRSLILSQKEEALLTEYSYRKQAVKNQINSDALEAQLYHHFYPKVGLVPNLPNNFTRKQYLDKLMEHIGIQ